MGYGAIGTQIYRDLRGRTIAANPSASVSEIDQAVKGAVEKAGGSFYVDIPTPIINRPAPPPPPPAPVAPAPAPAPAILAPTTPTVDSTREAAKRAKGRSSTLLTGYMGPGRARTRGRQKSSMQKSQIGLSETTKQTLLGTS